MRRITGELGLSRNTVTRDFEYLRDFFGAPLVYDRERNGHHYDPDEPVFELPGFWMNASELYALLACEQLLETVNPGLMAPKLAPLKQRIRALLGESGHDAESVSGRVRLQPIQTRDVPTSVFEPVAQATFESFQLRFEYRGRQRGEVTLRTVDPQRLLHYRHNWYLLAWCHKARALRLFSLDRIEHPEHLDKPASNRASSELDAFTLHSFGIFTGPADRRAVLLFNEQAARWVADETWHPDQQGEWQDGAYQLTLPYSNPTELTMEILRYGPDVEVLEPEELRNVVRQRLQAALNSYA
jgi:predicted DNA-binding transcriptional regulator YafY